MTARAVNPLGSPSVSHTHRHTQKHMSTYSWSARALYCGIEAYVYANLPFVLWTTYWESAIQLSWTDQEFQGINPVISSSNHQPSTDKIQWEKSVKASKDLPFCDFTYECLLQITTLSVQFLGTRKCNMCNQLNLFTWLMYVYRWSIALIDTEKCPWGLQSRHAG